MPVDLNVTSYRNDIIWSLVFLKDCISMVFLNKTKNFYLYDQLKELIFD